MNMKRTVSFLLVTFAALSTFVTLNLNRSAMAETLSRNAMYHTTGSDTLLATMACPDINACDAEILALELSGALLPPPTLYDRLYNDLVKIRMSYPEMLLVSHRPNWVLGELIVGLTQEAWEQFQAGTHNGLNQLSLIYGLVNVNLILPSPPALLFQFGEQYNPEYLVPLYEAVDGVRYAEPNILLGDGARIQVSSPEFEYTFSYGWGDCFAGCIFRHYWVFTIIDGSASLVSEYGNPIDLLVTSHYLPLVSR